MYLFRKVNGNLPYLMLMTSLGKTAFLSFGGALLVLLISFSCLMMQVTAVFPPEVFSAYMCRTALLTKLSTQLFQVFHVMEVYAKELSSCYALVGVITLWHKIACLQHRLCNLNINFGDLFLSWA